MRTDDKPFREGGYVASNGTEYIWGEEYSKYKIIVTYKQYD